ncbi:thioesterase family protein [Parvularcula sp. IMCC14364]|uniref:acyl-CoA thioesterase n=1 Tax=Parvularcula sp. IMCC14364 TaxID=3067902 RepID=UPI00274246B3|nr:thioesterase family protein [Parvularcula sp. IMCC14364]
MREPGLGAQSFETAYSSNWTPQQEDFDELGHVNNIVYVRCVQNIAVEHWSTVAPDTLQQQVHFVVLRHEIDYRDPLLPGDNAEIRTWLGRASGPRFDRHVDIRKSGSRKFSARARTTWCMLDRQTGRPRRISAEIFEAFGVTPDELD